MANCSIYIVAGPSSQSTADASDSDPSISTEATSLIEVGMSSSRSSTEVADPKTDIGNVEMASSIDFVVNTITVSKDPAEWEINDATINFLLSMSEIAQNLDEDFSTTRTFSSSLNAYRSLSKNVFKRKLQNGQEVNRKYLCFSVSKKALFCIPCLLFGGRSLKFGLDGYTDWNNINSGLNHHENSDEHMKCLTAFSI